MTTTFAYVTIRGCRSPRQVTRDASSPQDSLTFPFAALVIGHPNGTSTRFELSYCEQALRETGEAGFLVDLTQKQSAGESLTLCRIFVPADGQGEPVPSYPAADIKVARAILRRWPEDADQEIPKPRFKPGHKRAGDGYIACDRPGCCLPLPSGPECAAPGADSDAAACRKCGEDLGLDGWDDLCGDCADAVAEDCVSCGELRFENPCESCGHVEGDKSSSFDDVPDNPGPWNDDEDRHWFEIDGQTYGPFDTEDEAEKAFTYRMRTDDVPAISTADASEAFEGRRS